MKKYMNESRKFFIFEICFLFICSFLIGGLQFDILTDGGFHLRRINDIYFNIISGDVFCFVAENMLDGMGYASTGFYPSLLLIPFSALRCIFPSQLCFLMYLFFIEFLMAINSYIFIKQITNNKNKQFLFVIIYLILWPVLWQTFAIMALGMITAYALIPLILTGFIKILKGKKYGILLLSGGMTLLVHSHLIFSLIMVIILIVLFFINIKEFVKSPKKILNIIVSALICVSCCAVVIFPILEQLILNDCISNKFNKLPYIAVPGNYIFLLLSIFVSFYIFYKSKNKRKTTYLLISLWILLSRTNIFPWFLFPHFLKQIQFTSRLELLLAIPLGLYVIDCNNDEVKEKIIKSKMYFWVVFLFILIMMTVCCFSDNKYVTRCRIDNSNQCIGLGDYLPKNFFEDCNKDIYGTKSNNIDVILTDISYGRIKLFNKNYAFSLNNDLAYKIIDNNNYIFSNNNNSSIMIPKFYYKGYKIKLNGEEMDYYQGKYGLITIDTNINSGKISVSYDGTLVQNISKLISYISLTVFFIISNIIIIIKKKKLGYIFYNKN